MIFLWAAQEPRADSIPARWTRAVLVVLFPDVVGQSLRALQSETLLTGNTDPQKIVPLV
jgi:hypothetical protein